MGPIVQTYSIHVDCFNIYNLFAYVARSYKRIQGNLLACESSDFFVFSHCGFDDLLELLIF